VVAVSHEMAKIMDFLLRRDEPYRNADGRLVESKLKNTSKKALDGLWN
jgi:hypothetical protein